ncbi:hypothetical protein [Oceanispirochaeta sp.]|uniref:hypothetical protein n=1 Tax=Oceanispirochaeta sp. TaxID=2035350 RepID=UPI002630F389|nr:hypothetical protein [Oceanispirochaeta sp.]MDA3956530.1 hypothetical protein [Oceanispirochaeta sp.]
MKKILLLFMYTTLTFSLTAENIRGPVSGTLSLGGNTRINTRIENLCGIDLKNISPLIQGLKLTVLADDEMVIYRNSFALYLYKNLEGDFSEEKSSYNGTQAFMHFLTFSDSLNVLIPLDKNHTLSPDRLSYLLSDTDSRENFPMVLTILPITKGIPDSVYNKDITIEMTPVFFNKGSLDLHVLNDRGEELQDGIRISIDNKSYDWPGGPYILGAGLHNLDIRTDEGNEDSLSFTLKAGQTLSLDHVLQYQLPLLTIETIAGLSVYLDERLLTPPELDESIEIQPGSHSIRFELGNFRISRDFNAEMEQKMTITMVPEILMDFR